MATTLYLKQQFNSAVAPVDSGVELQSGTGLEALESGTGNVELQNSGLFLYASAVRSVLTFLSATAPTVASGSSIPVIMSGNTIPAQLQFQTNNPLQFVSPPIRTPFTLSGTVTFNVWAKVSNSLANTTVQVVLYRLSGGVLTAFLTSSFGTALTTTIGAKNWTGTPTSTSFAFNDRIVAVIQVTNATSETMGGPYTATVDFAGLTAAADGDAYFSLTETVTFQQEPEMIQEIDGSSPQTFAGATQSGNLIVFNCEAQSSAGVTMSDGQSDTFVNKCNVTWAAGTNFNTFGFAASIAGGSTTLTATNSDYIWAVEYGGMAAAPYDVGDTAGATGTGSSSAVASNAVTTNYPNELIVGMFDIGDGTSAPGASFINRSNQGGAIMDFSVTATGTYQATGTQTGNDGWAATVLTFKWGTQVYPLTESASLVAFDGAMAKKTKHHLAAALTAFDAVIVKKTHHALSAAITAFDGVLAKAHKSVKSLTATLTAFDGSMVKKTAHHMTAAITAFDAAIIKKTHHFITAAITAFDATLSAIESGGTMYFKTFSAALTAFDGTLTKRTAHHMTAAITAFDALVKKRTGHVMNATLAAFNACGIGSSSSQLASDNFHRADANPISGNWSTVTGYAACQIVSDIAEPTTTFPNRSTSMYDVLTWPSDQYSEITLENAPVIAYSAPAVRCSASGGYAAYVIGSSTNLVYLQTLAGSTFEVFPLTPSIGDVIRLSVIGNVLAITQNGNLIGSYTDTSNTFTSGNPGMSFVGGSVPSDAQISLWAGGKFAPVLVKKTFYLLSAAITAFDATLGRAHRVVKSLSASLAAFDATLVRRTYHGLAAALTAFDAVLIKKTKHGLTATLTAFDGVLTEGHHIVKILSASLAAFDAVLIKKTHHGLTATLAAFDAILIKRTHHLMSAAIAAWDGVVTKAHQVVKALSATLAAFDGALAKKTAYQFFATITAFDAVLTKHISYLLAASLAAWDGTLTQSKVFLKMLSATLAAFDGSMVRKTKHGIHAGLTAFNGVLNRYISHYFTASIAAWNGTLVKQTRKQLAAAIAAWDAAITHTVIHGIIGPIICSIFGRATVYAMLTRYLNARVLSVIEQANAAVQALVPSLTNAAALYQIQTAMATVTTATPLVVDGTPLVVGVSTLKLVYLMKAINLVRDAAKITPPGAALQNLRTQEAALYAMYRRLCMANLPGLSENQGPIGN